MTMICLIFESVVQCRLISVWAKILKLFFSTSLNSSSRLCFVSGKTEKLGYDG